LKKSVKKLNTTFESAINVYTVFVWCDTSKLLSQEYPIILISALKINKQLFSRQIIKIYYTYSYLFNVSWV